MLRAMHYAEPALVFVFVFVLVLLFLLSSGKRKDSFSSSCFFWRGCVQLSRRSRTN
jgi:hypothetical protein